MLERLNLTKPADWLEDAVDYYSLQALLFRERTKGFVGQIRTFFAHTKRVG